MTLIEALEQVIDSCWKLERVGSEWLMQEPNSTHSELRITAGKSFGFSLDKSGNNAFPLFKQNSPLEGMNKKCDGIIVTESGQRTDVILIEMKAGKNAAKEAAKQIESANLLIQWLLGLLDLYEHFTGQVTVIGVVSLKPRKTPNRGTTKLSSGEIPKPGKSPSGIPLFVLQNHPKLKTRELLKHLEPAA
ncbi:hypothetical protein [Parachitinimonas caeni]|uniref:Uncharacterized protein n=1 Tax=Parachitinimonas caeni TaxID=3031301 RepID=A0ABT7DUG4_9NEIS|nr:hypothetical protein [Parachitinimonas caeni]MDK2123697.1 hypothetical protein [Parachitinimonas caeni]